MKMFLRDILANHIQSLHSILNPSERKSWAHIAEPDSFKWHESVFSNSTVQLTKKETTCQHHPITFSRFPLDPGWQLPARGNIWWLFCSLHLIHNWMLLPLPYGKGKLLITSAWPDLVPQDAGFTARLRYQYKQTTFSHPSAGWRYVGYRFLTVILSYKNIRTWWGWG